ncbi:putative deoxycytidylate deaminase, partial [Tetrabaena socialis]
CSRDEDRWTLAPAYADTLPQTTRKYAGAEPDAPVPMPTVTPGAAPRSGDAHGVYLRPAKVQHMPDGLRATAAAATAAATAEPSRRSQRRRLLAPPPPDASTDDGDEDGSGGPDSDGAADATANRRPTAAQPPSNRQARSVGGAGDSRRSYGGGAGSKRRCTTGGAAPWAGGTAARDWGGAGWLRQEEEGARTHSPVTASGVGAVIVNSDNVILAIGYNGFPRGCCDSDLPWAKVAHGPDGRPDPLGTKYPYVVHAEANALLNKNAASVAGARVYVTMFPCN